MIHHTKQMAHGGGVAGSCSCPAAAIVGRLPHPKAVNNTIRQSYLERKLGLGRVDGDELAFLLSQRFQRWQDTSERQIDYPDADSPVISLRYDKYNVLHAIVPGDHLTVDIAESIARDVEAKLLAPPLSKVSSMVLFANVPVDGYWRYGNKLVIRRAPEQAPRPSAMMGKHPLMLEVAYNGAEDDFTNNIRWERESRQWALMLTLLVPGLHVPPRVEFQSPMGCTAGLSTFSRSAH